MHPFCQFLFIFANFLSSNLIECDPASTFPIYLKAHWGDDCLPKTWQLRFFQPYELWALRRLDVDP